MLNIVLFGPPGSGKGTQSEKLIEKFSLVHISTGDILRAEVAAQTELGFKAKTIMDSGILVPDEVVIGMIENKIKSNKEANGFIFDGFPRTVAQAEALDKILETYKLKVNYMVALEVPIELLIERLLGRAKVSGRADDTLEVIENRIKEYSNKTLPVANFYQNQSKFIPVDGVGEISEIFERICSVLK